ncbi:MAG TPA: SCO family protein [Xanthobacteraceae bacterium]|nr:SCO family protein [Xanthobacteraceae bacterium]
MSAAAKTAETAEIAATVVAIRHAPSRREELVALLAEQSPIYRGLSAGEAERLRGFILASFEKTGLPPSALPFVREELQTGINPYTVAAAAKALRRTSEISDDIFALLVAAAERIAGNDDNVQYETIDPVDRVTRRTGALTEIIRTIAASGPRARPLWAAIDAMAARGNVSAEGMMAIDLARQALSSQPNAPCCCTAEPPPLVLPAQSPAARDVSDLALEDQSGATFKYRDFLYGRPSVVTFFYTRCMNPEKCSLTVSKLAALQRGLAGTELGSRINVGAFTYDPTYDHARRLQIYGMERGFRFDDHNRFIRTVGSFAPLQAKFDLGVGFGATTVNRHSVELLILDAEGEPVRQFRRVQWDETEVVAAVREIARPRSAPEQANPQSAIASS